MSDGGRGRNGSRGQVETWPETAAWRRRAWSRWVIADAGGALVERVRRWAEADTGSGRLLPWLPVAFGFGIVLYFSAEREPIWWASVAVSLICAAFATLTRRRVVAFPVTLTLTAIAAGFSIATLRSVQIAHPILARPAGNVQIAGFVEVREERERSDRTVIRVLKLEGFRLDQKPDRVRISVRKGTAPPVGDYVLFRARLNPPLAPLRPGGYDFARDLYFQGIGATGFVLGPITTAEAPVSPGLWLRYASAIQGLRDAIDARIRAVVPGDQGAIASALITGKRDAISAPVNEAMYISSLAHVLSISGYHMALVAGVVFFSLRAFLALIPAVANRRPIKKWAALTALVAAAFYLLLSGAEVATQRAFIMTAIVLVGVMFDRPALTLRTLALAALGVMLFAPQAVVHPSFQMSFAATLALIAVYERGLPRIAGAETSFGARMAVWGGREIFGLAMMSLVAGLATTLYAAYHFHRLAPYGVLANLLAMPIVSIWVMPSGLLALLAIPFGFDGFLWRLMGEGIDWMIAVALWVASLPGAVGRIAAFGVGPLLVGTAGLIVLCLLRSPLRLVGGVLILLAAIGALRAPLPDVLVAADGQAVAVRAADGRLAVHRTGSDVFAVREWLAADGDARSPTDPTLGESFRCDETGCVAKFADGKLVSHVLAPEAFAEDCIRAAVVVTARDAPPACPAIVIDRHASRRLGAIALQRRDGTFDLTAARPAGQDRPWAGAQNAPTHAPGPAIRPRPRDATPSHENLEAGD
jgi:competence protein ComEC